MSVSYEELVVEEDIPLGVVQLLLAVGYQVFREPLLTAHPFFSPRLKAARQLERDVRSAK